jgi:hypothetical protein
MRAWLSAFFLGAVFAHHASAAEFSTSPWGEDFHLIPFAAITAIDLPDIAANAVAVDAANEKISLAPHIEEHGPSFGLEIGSRLDHSSLGPLRWRAKGFYTLATGSDSVSVDTAFGAFAWQGLLGGNNEAAAAADLAAGIGTAAVARSDGEGFRLNSYSAAVTEAGATAAAGSAGSLGSAFAAAGNIGDLGLSVSYDSEITYWGGEFAVALDSGDGGASLSPWAGPVFRGLQRELTSELREYSFAQGRFSLHETLDGQSWGMIIGLDLRAPLGGTLAADLSLAAAPLLTAAHYEGHEVNGASFAAAPLETSSVRQDPVQPGLLARASGGISFGLGGGALLRLGGEVEYLSAVPSLARSFDGAVSADAEEASASAGSCCGTSTPLAEIVFGDMLAYGASLSLDIPF